MCDEERRILVTFDGGFADVRAYPPPEHAGFIVFRLTSQEKAHVLDVARKLVTRLRDHVPANELWIVREHVVRIRS